jgi:hypothetical protein
LEKREAAFPGFEENHDAKLSDRVYNPELTLQNTTQAKRNYGLNKIFLGEQE